MLQKHGCSTEEVTTVPTVPLLGLLGPHCIGPHVKSQTITHELVIFIVSLARILRSGQWFWFQFSTVLLCYTSTWYSLSERLCSPFFNLQHPAGFDANHVRTGTLSFLLRKYCASPQRGWNHTATVHWTHFQFSSGTALYKNARLGSNRK